MADMDTYDGETRGYEGNNYQTSTGTAPGHQNGYYGHNERDYQRERSRSPGPDRDGDARIRDEPMNGRADRGPPPSKGDEDDESVNPGSNLFVTGIHPKLSEGEIGRLFGKYGEVEKCNIMRDPHTRESRGFGFVKMVTAEEADAAKEGLQGEVFEGRTISIEKARRAKPRTPTPGKYFGPPKRGPPPPRSYDPYYDAPRRGGDRDRYYDDRRDRGYGRRDDYRGGGRGGGYRDRYEDRGYTRRDDYPRSDRYAQRGDDRYGDRRGGGYGGGGYDRPPRGPPAEPAAGGYSGSSRDPPPPRDYDERPRRYD